MTERIFIHNPYDIKSTEWLNSLDGDVKIITAFTQAVKDLNIPIRAVPCLIDKQLILLTQPPYEVGTCIFEFQQTMWDDTIFEDDAQVFNIVVNGEMYSSNPSGGIVRLELNSSAAPFDIEIIAEGYFPWRGEIVWNT